MRVIPNLDPIIPPEACHKIHGILELIQSCKGMVDEAETEFNPGIHQQNGSAS